MSLPADVRRPLDALVAGASQVLGDALVGAWVVGSHALGSADAASDVDVVVVTDGRLLDPARAALQELHAGLLDARLDVAYADAADLRSPMTLGRRWPHVVPGAAVVVDTAHHHTASTRWVLRERGLTLVGPDPRGLVAEVGPDALRAEALGAARARAEALEDDPAADVAGLGPVVLGACRTLHTATLAEVAGVTAAARWALDHLDAGHHRVVEAALLARAEGPDGRATNPALFADARALVWDVVRLSGQAALEARES